MGNHTEAGGDKLKCCGTEFSLYVVVIIGLVTFAGLMAGLTLGLMSLGLVDLEVLIKSGRPQDRRYASKIYPVVKNQHLLLCTLLMGNALAMEALPIFLDKIVPNWAAVVISVTLILIFGEILPQAVCTRYGLKVGALLAPFVRVLLILFFPVSYPISKVLDWMLGKGHAVLLRRAELKTFVTFHGNEAGKGGDLTHDETTIIAGALELSEKTAKDAMTPISKAFSLDLDATLNLWVCGFLLISATAFNLTPGTLTMFISPFLSYRDTLNSIMTMGHSRVPVYSGNPRNIIGLILIKNLLSVDPDGAVPLRKMMLRKIPRVSEDMPLYDILNEFQKGHSHLACVYKDLNKSLEKMETSQQLEFKDSNRKQRGKTKSKQDSKNAGDAVSKSTTPEPPITQPPDAANDGGEKKSPPPTPAFKKRHKGCSYCILDIENAPVPEFPSHEQVVGVITMEDVIEELLQEEILDETDEYVNIHNRIKVNMHASQDRAPNAASQPSVNGTSLTGTTTPTLSSNGHSSSGSPTTSNRVSEAEPSKSD